METPTFEQLQRFSPKSIFTLVMLAAVTYFLLPQFADLPGIFREVRDAAWVWAVPTLLMSAVTYVGAAMGVLGAVPDRVSAEATVVTQVAAEFTGKIAPAGLGGMALNVRFLQRSGVDPAVATSGVGLSTVAGLLMHIVLLVVFTVWSRRTAFDIHLPRPGVLLIGLAAVVVVTAIGFAIPAVRAIVFRKVLPIVRRAFVGIGRVLPPTVEGVAAVRWLDGAHAGLHRLPVLRRRGVRHAHQLPGARGDLPRGVGRGHGGAHAGRARVRSRRR